MNAWIGLALLPLVAVAMLGTGLPAFVVLIGAAGAGAVAIVAAGDTALLGALPSRLVGLLESDLLQALPLFVFMGLLIERLPIGGSLFRLANNLTGNQAASPRIAALLIGGLLAPMNGSVGASVAMLSRIVRPRLAAMHVDATQRTALIAAAATLGVVIPPSLVLIFLGDTMMAAHTLASSIAHRSDRIINTQDIFRAALAPAALVFFGWLAVAIATSRRTGAMQTSPLRITRSDVVSCVLAVGLILTLLGGVALGAFYAVEAAATGGVVLLCAGIATRALPWRALSQIAADTLAITGALFALLVGATTLTLVLRILGADRLLTGAISSAPGGETGALVLLLVIIGLAALVLDAFEITFVLLPILMPGVLVRVADAPWAAAVTVLALQASFLAPPFGFAVLLTRSGEKESVPNGALARALGPFLAVQILVIGVTLAAPRLVHVFDAPLTVTPPNTAVSPTDFGLPPPPVPAPLFDNGRK